MSQSVALKCLDKYGFPLAGLTAAEQAVRTEAAARETKLQEKWSRQVLAFHRPERHCVCVKLSIIFLLWQPAASQSAVCIVPWSCYMAPVLW